MASVKNFSLREILLLTAVVALGLALWLTAARLPARGTAGSLPANSEHLTVRGPIVVSYRQRTAPNATSGADEMPLDALHFIDGGVVFEYSHGDYSYIKSSRLESLRWRAAN